VRERVIHRRGVLFAAALHVPSGFHRPGLARLSATFGSPSPLPDWVGLGIRLTGDEHNRVDLLLASAGPERGRAGRALAPTRDVLACAFTSRVPAPLPGGGLAVVEAVPVAARSSTLAGLGDGAAACPIAYRLATAGGIALGTLELIEPAPAGTLLRLAPPVAGPEPFTRVRRRIYDWCQRP
jgi:hypothetical protein